MNQTKPKTKKASITKAPQTKIMVFGTFDMIHEGHRNLFAQARALAKNPKLIVSLARTKNVTRIKGRAPRSTEAARLARVKALPEVDRAILGAVRNYFTPILRIQPDIIALGYDQKAYVKTLRADLKKAGLTTKVVRLKPFQPEKYKTSLLRK
ncbi:TPA: FAD synthase [Patescibacteria group bacterium]|mgnify:CR=1 FL=1|jgi:FAD synthetase|nr:FAD synthase [Patescibacteria group bacterium]